MTLNSVRPDLALGPDIRLRKSLIHATNFHPSPSSLAKMCKSQNAKPIAYLNGLVISAGFLTR